MTLLVIMAAENARNDAIWVDTRQTRDRNKKFQGTWKKKVLQEIIICRLKIR